MRNGHDRGIAGRGFVEETGNFHLADQVHAVVRCGAIGPESYTDSSTLECEDGCDPTFDLGVAAWTMGHPHAACRQQRHFLVVEVSAVCGHDVRPQDAERVQV